MDCLDQQLIGLLRTNARSTVATLAHKLGVSRGTVKNRITKLEDDGVITGYTVRLKPDTEPNEIKAWTSIAVEGNQMREVIAALLGEPGVAAVHDTNGRWDLLAEIRINQPDRARAGAGAAAPDQGHRRHRDQHPSDDVQDQLATSLQAFRCGFGQSRCQHAAAAMLFGTQQLLVGGLQQHVRRQRRALRIGDAGRETQAASA